LISLFLTTSSKLSIINFGFDVKFESKTLENKYIQKALFAHRIDVMNLLYIPFFTLELIGAINWHKFNLSKKYESYSYVFQQVLVNDQKTRFS